MMSRSASSLDSTRECSVLHEDFSIRQPQSRRTSVVFLALHTRAPSLIRLFLLTSLSLFLLHNLRLVLCSPLIFLRALYKLNVGSRLAWRRTPCCDALRYEHWRTAALTAHRCVMCVKMKMHFILMRFKARPARNGLAVDKFFAGSLFN